MARSRTCADVTIDRKLLASKTLSRLFVRTCPWTVAYPIVHSGLGYTAPPGVRGNFRTMKDSNGRIAGVTGRDAAKNRTRTIFATVVCFICARPRAVTPKVVYQTSVDGASRNAAIWVRASERIGDKPRPKAGSGTDSEFL